MSAINYYLEAGHTPRRKTVTVSGPNTFTIWAPDAGKVVHITNLSISSNNGGTIAFYFDNGNDEIARFVRAGSATIVPEIGCWQSTVVSGRIFGVIKGGATDECTVNATGFEL